MHVLPPSLRSRLLHAWLTTALVMLGLSPSLAGDVPPVVGIEPAYVLGQKWVTEHQVSSLVGPSVRVDGRGRVALAWMEDDRGLRSVWYRRAPDANGTMAPPVRVNGADEILYWRQESPALAVYGEEVYVSWAAAHPKAGPTQPLATELRLSRSVDGGRSFLPSVLVNDDPGVIQHTFDALARAPDGRLHLSWIDAREGKNAPGTYAARSIDRGVSLSDNVKIDDDTCVCCRTALATGPDGMVYVAWRKIFEGQVRETVMARSSDGGETFDPSVIVGHDGWVFPACPHRPASIGVDGQGRVYVTWYTEGADEMPTVYVAYSDDRGASFSPKVKVNISANTFPDHPQLAVDSAGHLVVIWEELGPVKREVVVSVSLDRGHSFSAPRKLNERKSQTPTVAANADGLFALAWLEHGMPGHKMIVQTLQFASEPVATAKERRR